MSKHTPGPWLPNDDCREIVAVENGFMVASIHGPDHRLTGKDRREGHACATANARLIAAAPDLLEALQRFVALMQSPSSPARMRALEAQTRDACAAIARATGETA